MLRLVAERVGRHAGDSCSLGPGSQSCPRRAGIDIDIDIDIDIGIDSGTTSDPEQRTAELHPANNGDGRRNSSQCGSAPGHVRMLGTWGLRTATGPGG
ncbi:hypothetical protein GCM10022284_58710 [Streptomyces hundungensis]